MATTDQILREYESWGTPVTMCADHMKSGKILAVVPWNRTTTQSKHLPRPVRICEGFVERLRGRVPRQNLQIMLI